MVVGAFVETNGIGSRRRSPPRVLSVVETQRTDACVSIKIAECLSGRVQCRICFPGQYSNQMICGRDLGTLI